MPDERQSARWLVRAIQYVIHGSRDAKNAVTAKTTTRASSQMNSASFTPSAFRLDMPSLPLKPCAAPYCSRLVTSGRCEEHTRSAWSRLGRDPQAERFYQSPAWKRTRAAQLAREPRCRECGARAVTVDHIAAFRADGGSRLDPANLQSLCRPCHDRKSAEERNARRRQASS